MNHLMNGAPAEIPCPHCVRPDGTPDSLPAACPMCKKSRLALTPAGSPLIEFIQRHATVESADESVLKDIEDTLTLNYDDVPLPLPELPPVPGFDLPPIPDPDDFLFNLPPLIPDLPPPPLPDFNWQESWLGAGPDNLLPPGFGLPEIPPVPTVGMMETLAIKNPPPPPPPRPFYDDDEDDDDDDDEDDDDEDDDYCDSCGHHIMNCTCDDLDDDEFDDEIDDEEFDEDDDDDDEEYDDDDDDMEG